jgi:hypothetical protein
MGIPLFDFQFEELLLVQGKAVPKKRVPKPRVTCPYLPLGYLLAKMHDEVDITSDPKHATDGLGKSSWVLRIVKMCNMLHLSEVTLTIIFNLGTCYRLFTTMSCKESLYTEDECRFQHLH